MRRSLGLIVLVFTSASHAAADGLLPQIADEPRGVVSLEEAFETAATRSATRSTS